MVEIKRTDLAGPSEKLNNSDDDKYRLLYSKSKIYVNPTAYARDNIPGFVALVKRASWPSVHLLHGSNAHLGSNQPNLSFGMDTRIPFEWEGDLWMGQICKSGRASNFIGGGGWYVIPPSFHSSWHFSVILDIVLIELPTQRPESYAFSVPLTSIYSLIVHPPSLSSWCA